MKLFTIIISIVDIIHQLTRFNQHKQHQTETVTYFNKALDFITLKFIETTLEIRF